MAFQNKGKIGVWDAGVKEMFYLKFHSRPHSPVGPEHFFSFWHQEWVSRQDNM